MSKSLIKKILVIGSNSFAGSSFISYLLDKGNLVYGVSRSPELEKSFLAYKNNKKLKNFKFSICDLNKDKDLKKIIKQIKKNKVDYVVNFAAQGMVAESWIKPEDWYKTNILSNSKLIKELQKLKLKKYLNFSTPEVYGNTPKKIKESNNFYPSTPYAISRAAQDMNLLAYRKFFNFPAVFTRTANIFGPYQQLYRIVPKAIMCAKKKLPLQLHGGGLSIRSFILMDDVNEALYKILIDKKNVGETYHISTNKFISIKNLVELIFIKLKADKKLINIVSERKGKDHGYLLDSSKLRKKYSWKDKSSLEKGIDNTIDWIEKNYSTFKLKNLNYKHKS